jgi:N-acyl homoserine lactone hydrolase
MIEPEDICRIVLGCYTMPAASSMAGEKIVACAYLVRFDSGLLLFDTGIGTGHPESEEEFGPIIRRDLEETLGGAGTQISDVTVVANCHLHLDHCGGNPLFPKIPIFVQRDEMDALPTLDYIVPGLVDFNGASLQIHEGEAKIAPGLRIIPTPGHTPGHQSLLIETTQGKVLLAGQAMDFASDYARAHFTRGLLEQKPNESTDLFPGWFESLCELDVRAALFAHDVLPWSKSLQSGEALTM